MKKYPVKIYSVILPIIIFPLAGSFCVMGLLDPVFGFNPAPAVSGQHNNDNPIFDEDACTDAHSAGQERRPVPLTGHHNSLLPCCMDGSHSSYIALVQSDEIIKAVPASFMVASEPLPVTAIAVIYPVTAPPPLSFFDKTAVLRI
jgi:hypothetical protein